MKKLFYTCVPVIAAVFMLFTGCSTKTSPEPVGAQSAAQNGEPTHLIFALPKQAHMDDMDEVFEEINKLTLEEINCTVEPLFFEYGNYNQQIALMLSSGEQLDLFMTGAKRGYATQVVNGSLVPLDDLIEEYCPAIQEYIPEDILKCTRVNGKCYAIPTVRDWGLNYSWMVTKEVYDKYDIGSYDIQTFNDLTPIFKKIVEGEGVPCTAGLGAGKSVADAIDDALFDSLFDGLGGVEWGNNTKVVNIYETETYRNLLDLVHEWYEIGAIPADLSTQSSTPQELIASGYTSGMFYTWKPGHDTQESYKIGKDVVSVITTPSIRTTSDVASVMWSIPVNTVNKEKAAQFLNMMYGSKEYMDLFSYGIEGKHYQLIDKENGIIDYPEGVDSGSTTYSPQAGWLFGNQFLNYIFTPNQATLWKDTEEWNNSMEVVSPLSGYICDESSVTNEVAACQNVVSQYERTLGNGEVDPDTLLPQFISDLKAAGIDKIVAVKQQQVDEFLTSDGSGIQPDGSTEYSSSDILKPVR
ncbi:ABC transporter substrate-binding protein [Enterocloster citroniae]|uniref:ABC transporter substrate-binding protein n=1 Tax=Enterocloster citroniae TaxID=358743 RepID=UPI0008E69F39|nr:ABC transporter substrate-binding protein [Enterocloster citroniae]SFS23610.1 putative aldouronate transport system substrate-binding protein [Enterocloster citroniae]